MKSITVLSFLGLLASTAFTAPSHPEEKDATLYLHEQSPASPAPIDLGTVVSGDDLSNGVYIITSPVLDDGWVIGRGLEDLSLLPKRIKTISLQDPRTQPQWYVERLPNGKYRLRSARDAVGPIDRLLFAILLPEPPAGEWVITFRPNHNAYTIEESNTGRGWIASPEEGAQVRVDNLIVGPSDPPFFPKPELFTFKRIDDGIAESSKKFNVDVKVTVEEL